MSEKQSGGEQFVFQAEIQQLLDILTHSLYTHRDIFIRELISNAADALDKARFKSIKGETLADPDLDFEIRIDLDKDKRIITICDTGIGMTHDELVRNIGTIARSGTSEFLKTLGENGSDKLNLIGRFGVGFYSVFMAGEKVEIVTRPADPEAPAHRWISDGKGSYQIEPGPDDAKRGTEIRVHLREDALQFTEKFTVESAIKKYSNFVPFPIKIDGEQINKQSAIWREPKSSVTEEQYKEFFKFIANETEDPLTWMHFSADAPIQFHALLFVPKKTREIFGFGKDETGINLFVRRVMVDNHAQEVLPDYLRFVRGVLDSDDLPLNISRETLQENPYLRKISTTVVGRFLSHLQELSEKQPETFQGIWNQYGRVLKEGYMDFTHKDKLAPLFRFDSSKNSEPAQTVSLSDYVKRMRDKQEAIYYLSGATREAIEKNPTLEIFKAKDIEVLYCTDPVDEFALPGLIEFEGKSLQSVDQADLKKIESIEALEKKEEKAEEEKISEKELKNLARRIKDILGERVEDVELSQRLVDSPAVLVGTTPGMSAQMERLMHLMHEETAKPKRKMEINGKHPLIRRLLQIYQTNPKDPFLVQAAETLFDSVVLLDGFIADPHAMALRSQQLLTQSTELYLQKPGQSE
ncbi:molecular chaperone HtpG [candidate division KSB1 bacterium]|nr:molecular chaperone HtpG [candidate division KSB1 bacterium]